MEHFFNGPCWAVHKSSSWRKLQCLQRENQESALSDLEVKSLQELMGDMVSAGGQEKEWMGRLLDEIRVFGIDHHKWNGLAPENKERSFL